MERNKPDQSEDVDYSIPSNLTSGKETVTVRFQPVSGKMVGGFFGAALLKPLESAAIPSAK